MKTHWKIFLVLIAVAVLGLGFYFARASVISVEQLDVGDITVAPFTLENTGDSFYDMFLNNFSSDNRYVVFQSNGGNLVAGDTNGAYDVFRRDTLTNTTIRVSVSSAGVEGNSDSAMPSISDNGRYVVFYSDADNLVAGDTNNQQDIFVRDIQTNTTTRVSVDSLGVEADDNSYRASISGDGRYVAFESSATNLVAGDTNFLDDMFLHDMQTGATTRLSVSTAGVESNDQAGSYPNISRDGKFVVFVSYASNLVAGDTNGQADVFVRDIDNNITTRASVSSLGAEGNSDSYDYYPAISGDGRYVAFVSNATNLVTGDTNVSPDIFRHDNTTGATVRVSLSSLGDEANSGSQEPSISNDGRYISYTSGATNLITGDTDGEDDVFVTDMDTGETIRASESASAAEPDAISDLSSISGDGAYVSFWSLATNLIDGDTGNGAGNYFMAQLPSGAPAVVDPTVTTSAATAIGQTTATLHGDITDDGGENETDRGFEYSTDMSYGSSTTESGSFPVSSFTADLTTLSCNTGYNFRAYAINSSGTGYGANQTFTTSACAPSAPTITTSAASNVTKNSATLNGNITSTGGQDATDRGFNYGLTLGYGTTVTASSGPYSTGAFSMNISGLECHKTYNFQSFAINSGGTGSSSNGTFTTENCPSSSGGSSVGFHPSTPSVPVVVPPVVVDQTPTPPVPTPKPTSPDSNNFHPPVTPTIEPTPPENNNEEPVVITPDTDVSNSGDNSNTHPSPSSTGGSNASSHNTDIIGRVKSAATSVLSLTSSPSARKIETVALYAPLTVSMIALLASILGGLPIVNYFLYLSTIVAQILGIKRKTKPWGTVYDSATKRPIPFARVEIVNAELRKLQSIISDSEGRYGFLVSEQLVEEGGMQLRAFQNKYSFPSIEQPTDNEKILYPHIYQGGTINLSNSVANYDVPIDPIGASMKRFYFGITSITINNIISYVANVLFFVGVVLGITNFVLTPSGATLGILGIIFLTYLLRASGLKLKPFGVTKDIQTGQSMPFGFIALHSGVGGERVGFTVSDDKGRYFLLTQKGKYLLKAYTPAHILPTRMKEIPILTQSGWISKEIGI